MPRPRTPRSRPGSPGRKARAGCLALCLLIPSAALAGDWININPGGGGAFTSIGAGPTGILICGADLSGAYRSLDHGLTWDRIGSDRGLRRTHVSAVAFDPLDPLIVYLGTEVGLYRSGDAAQNFTRVLDTGYIGAVAAAPSDPTIVYAAYHPLFDQPATDIYKSIDRGLTWSVVSDTLPPDLRLMKLVVSPADPGTVFAVSGDDLFVNGVEAVYRSVDGGVSWSRIGESLGPLWDLAMDPSTPATLYVTAWQPVLPSGWTGTIYKSTDGGDTWTPKAAHTGAILVKRDQPQVVRVIDVRRHSSDPESGVWESIDGGEIWTRKSTMAGWGPGWQALDWAYGGGFYGMAKILGQDLSAPDAIYWANSLFPFGSQNGGATFQNLSTTEISPGRWHSRGIDNVTLTALTFTESAPAQAYVGFYDIGFWRTVDGGASWQAGNPPALTGSWAGNGGHTTSILADPARPGVVWATFGGIEDSLRLAKSTAGGTAASWVAVSGLPTGYQRGLSLDRGSPTVNRTLFVTANGDVYRSQDDGANWTIVLDCDSCRATAVDRSNSALVYAGGEGGLWRSLAGGAPGSWSKVGPLEMSGPNTRRLPEERWEGVHQIVTVQGRPGWALVAVHGPGRGFYRTTDSGLTWTKLRNATWMRDVAIDPTDPNVLYAASSRAFKSGASFSGSEGLERSVNGGVSWTSLNDGLAWPFAARIAIDPANNQRLVLGSPGNGFFERTLTGTVVGVEPVGAPGDGGLSGPRPNPARGAVAFTLALARPARVEWSVHDLQGREVWRGAQDCGAGTATLAFDPEAAATRLRGGVYFARFGVEGRVLTRRFALLK